MDHCDPRNDLPPDHDPDCLFCSEKVRARALAENGTVFAIEDAFPVTPGHILLIPTRHTRDYFTMTSQQYSDTDELLGVLKEKLCREDDSITGFNIGVNCGSAAGQTVRHVHMHFIPRYEDDVDDPTGGVRNVIPGKGNYLCGWGEP